MSGTGVSIQVTGVDESIGTLREIHGSLHERGRLHAEIANTALAFTRAYLRGLNRHKTASRLGAKPTYHHERSAQSIQGEASSEAAILRIPRRTGLGRALGFVVIRPTGGRRFLTIPAGPDTYGRQAGEYPKETLQFATIQTHRGPTPVLLWKTTAGRHQKGEVAFWLRREVYQPQDPTLLPSDSDYETLGRRVITAYIDRATKGYDGPRGGTSTGMPSA